MPTQLNPRQLTVVHWLPAATSIISFCCSAVLAVHILYHPKRRSYHRLLLGMSICDMLASLAMFAARFFDMEEPSSAACSNLGAVQVFAYGASVFYNGCLAILFLLMVKFGTQERKVVTYFEIPSHLGCIAGPTIGAVSAYFSDSLNPVSFSTMCWLGPYPQGCRGAECARGGNWGFAFHMLSHAIFYAVVLILAASNVLIYCKVRETLGRTRRYSVESIDPPRFVQSNKSSCRSLNESSGPLLQEGHPAAGAALMRMRSVSLLGSNRLRPLRSISSQQYSNTTLPSKSRQVAVRSFLFCGGFILTYTFAILMSEIGRWTKYSVNDTWWFYTVMVLDGIFWPLQGFWDSVIFFRPRYIRWRSARPTNSRFFALRKTLFSLAKPASRAATKRRTSRGSKLTRSPTNDNMDDDDELSIIDEADRSEDFIAISVPLGDSQLPGVVG